MDNTKDIQQGGYGANQKGGEQCAQKAGDYSTQVAGDYSTQTAGGSSTQTAGYSSTQKAGYNAMQKAEDNATQTACGNSTQKAWHKATQTAGGHSTQKAGNSSTQKSGDGSTQKAGGYSAQTAGYSSTQKAGDYSTQTAEHNAAQKAGDSPTQIAWRNSTQKAGYRATQTAWDRATQTAGDYSTQIAWHNATQKAGYGSFICHYVFEGAYNIIRPSFNSIVASINGEAGIASSFISNADDITYVINSKCEIEKQYTTTPDDINNLEEFEIIVFGSNLNGDHAGGLARVCADKFGAEHGVGEGRTGQCYALPTLGASMERVSAKELRLSVAKLVDFANQNTGNIILLTKVGCGIAGFKEDRIKNFFKDLPANIIKPKGW